MLKVFRPGVFDLFHVGHLNAIREAEKAGDYLVVGVQDGRSVYEQKGKYPLIPLSERMAIVESISGVDEVVSYRNTDLIRLLKNLDIDILAVGEGYGETPEQKRTLEYCAKNLTVIESPRTGRVSSTHRRKLVSGFWGKTRNTMLSSFGGDQKKIQEETLREAKLFCGHLSDTDRVLDLGCGNGRLTKYLGKSSWWVNAVDYASNFFPREHAGNIRYIQDDVCNYSTVGFYDAIVMSGLLPCLDDEQVDQVIELCENHLQASGKILIRATVADQRRIDIINQYSEQLGRFYTAYYRTETEIEDLMARLDLKLTHKQFLYRNQPDTYVTFLAYER